MEKLTKLMVDCSTGEQNLVELSEDELAQLEKDRAEVAAQRAAQEAAEADKKARRDSAKSKLKALGLTEEEVSALL